MPKQVILAAINSPLGDITLVLDEDVILVCEFADREARVAKQLRHYYPGYHIVDGSAAPEIVSAFKAYFDGDLIAIEALKTAPMGTAYEQTVWTALKNIPAGFHESYGAIAAKLNSSPRAVGRANGRNPICLLHPCHRVIGADGSLTGYAGGLNRKEWLLKHEGAILNL